MHNYITRHKYITRYHDPSVNSVLFTSHADDSGWLSFPLKRNVPRLVYKLGEVQPIGKTCLIFFRDWTFLNSDDWRTTTSPVYRTIQIGNSRKLLTATFLYWAQLHFWYVLSLWRQGEGLSLPVCLCLQFMVIQILRWQQPSHLSQMLSRSMELVACCCQHVAEDPNFYCVS